MYIEKLASAIYNDIVSGLQGYHSNPSISLEQLEDEIVETRLSILKEYALKGVPFNKDLYVSINCIPVDCEVDIERCHCTEQPICGGTKAAHFEIPQILDGAIDYIGSPDREVPFIYYTSLHNYRNHKYRKRGKNKPYVWIDMTPNKNNMYDCFVFNAPLLKQVTVSAIFKDPRQIDKCCVGDDSLSFLDSDIKERLIKQKIQYYRQLAAPIRPNTQEYTA